ncbi:MAG: TatD family hydrolase [Bacteroidetes bacterium]|nr:TatD family hydrolase [Bacteroidota bacterium]
MIPYIDIHSHHQPSEGILAIQNILNPDVAAPLLEKEGLYSIGIHPRHIHPDHWLDDVTTLKEYIHHPKVLAIGEAGLDGLTDLPLSLQEDVFIAMVQLSEEAKKPLIIHSVRTHHEISIIHRNLKPTQPWILHGFNVRNTIAKGMISHGLYLSFGESLLKHHSPSAEVVSSMPLDLLFIETDDKQIDIKELYQRVATLRDLEMEVLKNDIYQRFCKIFGYAGT